MYSLKNKQYIVLAALCIWSWVSLSAQYRKSENLPYADQKLYHFGFNLGLHTQDMPIVNSGFKQEDGEVWFADIPSYSFGFSIGLIADRYLNEYFNLRINPTVHFGEKRFVFREQATGEEYEKAFKGNYMTVPLHVKFSAPRTKNYRPYLIAGPYVAFDIGATKNEALRFNGTDYGLEFGIGCNFYLQYFKVCPEIKFSLGLADMINTNRSDLTEPTLLKYSNAVSGGKNRMISLVINFE